MNNWVTGRVKKIKFWTSTLFSLTIHAPIQPFIAGQFTKLGLEINGYRVQRAYSYVNAPDNDNLEFYLVIVPNGNLSLKLALLKPGDEIQIFSQSSGFFILKEIPNCTTLWMLATGTALGPYLSILKYGKDLERFKNIVLVHAVRYISDLNYQSQIQKLQKRYKQKLIVQTIVSREIAIGSLTGHIPELIDSRQLEEKVGLTINPKTSHVMLCGNPHMVRDTQQLLSKTRHMNKHLRRRPGHVTTEHYW